MKKKKILFGTVHMEVGGIEKTLIGLLNRIDYKKYDVDLLLLKTNGDFMNEIPKDVNVITPYKSKILNNIVNSNNIFCKVIKHSLFNYSTGKFWINKKNYDVAISYSGYYSFIDTLIGNSNAKKKLIWVHTDLKFLYENDLKYKRKFDKTKKKYDIFDKIVCVSESAKKHFTELLNEQKEKLEVQWNIIDIQNNNSKVPKLKGSKKIVSVGRLCDQKRFDRLIEIQKKLVDNKVEAVTYLIGDGENKKQLEDKIKEYKLEKRFIMLGKQINVMDIIKQADLFVSTSDYEGWPTVIIETLICGIPFVGPDVCGIRDIALNIAPKNSYILTNNSVDDIYDGVIAALNGKISKNFNFDLEKYNNSCMNNFYKYIVEDNIKRKS